MRYIITGGAGFIGSHIADVLIDNGNEVIVIDDLSTGSLDNLKQISSSGKFRFIEMDVCSVRNWNEILNGETIIIHLAAAVGVDYVCREPLLALNNNYMSTRAIIDAAIQFNTRIFFASSSEVYGELKTFQSVESDLMAVYPDYCGRTGYIIGKIMSEYYCINAHRKYGLPVIVGRFFNVTGIRQVSTYGMVIPTFIKLALAGQPLVVYGNGNQTRTFCSVHDMVKAILLLVECDHASGEIFNLSGCETVTIREVAEYTIQSANSSSSIVYQDYGLARSNGRDIINRNPSMEKVKRYIDWHPEQHWKEVIDEMVAYARLKLGDYEPHTI